MEEPKYKRVLLKISGEALAGDKHFGLDFDVIGKVCDVVKQCGELGVQRFFCCFVNGGVCQPLMVSFHVIQFDSSLCSLSLFVYTVSSPAAAVFGMVCRKKEGLT